MIKIDASHGFIILFLSAFFAFRPFPRSLFVGTKLKLILSSDERVHFGTHESRKLYPILTPVLLPQLTTTTKHLKYKLAFAVGFFDHGVSILYLKRFECHLRIVNIGLSPRVLLGPPSI